jgi:hypothetical protein
MTDRTRKIIEVLDRIDYRNQTPQRLAEAIAEVDGLPQTSKEPIGYGYSHEIQSGLGSYFIVVREKQNKYDTPIYAGSRPNRGGDK